MLKRKPQQKINVRQLHNTETKTIFHLFPTSSKMDKPTCQRTA